MDIKFSYIFKKKLKSGKKKKYHSRNLGRCTMSFTHKLRMVCRRILLRNYRKKKFFPSINTYHNCIIEFDFTINLMLYYS